MSEHEYKNDKIFDDLSWNNIKDEVMLEIGKVLRSFKENDVNDFVQKIVEIKNTGGKICGYGAGRMGYGLRAFMMRLNHLGIPAYFIGDTFIPPMDENDLFIVTSGSGETKSVFNLLDIAKVKANMQTCAITGNSESTMAKYADISIVFKSSNGGLNSEDNDQKINSIQPMTSLNEQSMFVFFDIVAVMLIKALGIKKEDEKKFHFNVE